MGPSPQVTRQNIEKLSAFVRWVPSSQGHLHFYSANQSDNTWLFCNHKKNKNKIVTTTGDSHANQCSNKATWQQRNWRSLLSYCTFFSIFPFSGQDLFSICSHQSRSLREECSEIANIREILEPIISGSRRFPVQIFFFIIHSRRLNYTNYQLYYKYGVEIVQIKHTRGKSRKKQEVGLELGCWKMQAGEGNASSN